MCKSGFQHQIISGLWLCIALSFLPNVYSAEHSCTSSSCETCPHSIPELWVVNSRCAPRCTGLDAGFEQLTYERWDEQRCVFVRETRESFLVAQANIPTLLFSHGNTLTHEQAMNSCWKIRERLRACAGRKMMVYWSWPAEILYTKPLIRPLDLLKRNLQAKYVYSEYQGYYIAKLANMMSTAQPLSLGGHSYGGVCAICALHYLGGGELNGLVLEGGAPVERPNLRAVIVSGALDNDSMYPGYRYGQTFAPVETFYTTYNVRDSTLKRWPKYSFRGQEAAGYTGICAARLGPYADKLFQQKLTEDVGKSHYIRPHLASDRMITAVCNTAFPSHEFMPCGCQYCTELAAKLRDDNEQVAGESSEDDAPTNVAQLEVTAL
jgi:pimeloyl-ACP methyl ester carboxylesterase